MGTSRSRHSGVAATPWKQNNTDSAHHLISACSSAHGSVVVGVGRLWLLLRCTWRERFLPELLKFHNYDLKTVEGLAVNAAWVCCPILMSTRL